jgi:flagellar basal body-associated protein FliL
MSGAAAAAAEPKPKKPIGLIAIILVAGLALGGGGASAYFLMMAPKAADAHAEAEPEPEEPEELLPPEFVTLDRFQAPLLGADLSLAGYVTLSLAFEVETGQMQIVESHLPLVQHEINVMLATTVIGQKEHPRLVDVPKAAKLILEAANKALPEPKIKAVRIVSAMPI